uniref:Uncharacterized protein n=1 Tax=Anopheles stephensi TaxID=30069 RepID=A0A182Y8X9_ANOST
MQAEQLQAYFDEYRDLMAWINEMLAKITAPDLAKDVAGAEALIGKIREHRTEVEARKEAFEVFNRTGRKLIHDKHFLANEVQEKIAVLEQRKRLLDNTIVQRLEMYELNLDTQRFLKEAEDMEGWIISRQMQLKDSKLGDSIAQVEDLLRKHEDFEKTVAAQEEKVLALKRITLLEQRFKKQLEAEQAARIAEKERIERERHEALKQKEVQRITEERRRREPASINGYNDSVSGMGNASGGHLSSPAGAGMMVDRNDSSVGSGAGMMNTSNSTASVGVSNADQTSPVQKSNSFATMLQERLRRGSDSNIKRAESMKMGLKPVKRAPSFTTRRRAQSFRKNQRTGGAGSESDASLLPPVEVQGLLERKHELQSGGKKAPVRSWKPYYTVLCGQLLCFFKDSEDFAMQKAATAPVNILNAKCERAENYTKKKNVFRLVLLDGSEFLFMTTSKESLNEWVNKIAFHAALPPNLQLMSYDESVKQNNSAPDMKSISSAQSPTPDRSDAASSISSRTSSPDSQRRDSRTSLNSAKSGSGSNGSFHTPQTNFLQKQKELREQELQHQRMSSGQQYNNLPSPTAPGPMPEVFGLADKPPIPPRGMPPPVPQRQSSTDNVLNSNNGSVQMRSKPPGSANSPNGSDYDNANIRPYSLQPGAMSSKSPPASQNGGNLTGEDVWLRNSEIRTSDYSVPPLPVTSTPLSTFTPLKPPSGYQHPAQHYHQQSPSSATGTATSTFQPHPNHNMPQQPQKHQIDQFIRREQQTGNSSSARTGNNGTSRTTWHHPIVPTGNGTGNTTNEQQQQLAYHGNGKQSHHHQHHHPHHHGPQGSMGTQPPPPPPPTHMANSSSNTFGNSINLDGFSTGWGQTRFDAARPTSLPPAGVNNNNNNNNGGSTSGGPTTTASLVGQDFGQLVSGGVGRHQSAESSSESEASFIKGGKESSSGKDKKGVFRIFSKKKSKNSS